MLAISVSKAFDNLRNQFSYLTPIEPAYKFDSVVAMAVYSGDRLVWLKQAIASILEQSYASFLYFIVIDGEVDDDTLTFLIDISQANRKIVLALTDSNIGLSGCMNYAVEQVMPYCPRYFFRMDADDVSYPERLEKQVAFFESNPRTSILGSGLIEINEKGKKVGQRKLPLEHGDIVRFLPKRCSINHPTVAMRFSIFEQGHRYKEELKNTQDYFFWADLVAAGFKFANLSDRLLKFRRVNNFYKRRGLGKSLNEFKARFYTMRKLDRFSVGNVLYAFSVLFLRLMPAKIVKLAYMVDRYFLNKRVKH